MGMICAATGMRIGEALGLKRQDIHFATCPADVLRSLSDGAIGPRKTEISQQPMPLDDIVLEGLRYGIWGWPISRRISELACLRAHCHEGDISGSRKAGIKVRRGRKMRSS